MLWTTKPEHSIKSCRKRKLPRKTGMWFFQGLREDELGRWTRKLRFRSLHVGELSPSAELWERYALRIDCRFLGMPLWIMLPLPTILRAVSGKSRQSNVRQMPLRMTRSQKIHLQPMRSANAPPRTGPRLGATFGPRQPIPTWEPRSARGARSATTPYAIAMVPEVNISTTSCKKMLIECQRNTWASTPYSMRRRSNAGKECCRANPIFAVK